MGLESEDREAVPDYETITVRPLAPALGAEISGVNLASDLSTRTISEIRQAWLTHSVVFFRDQTLTSKEYLNFAQTIGEPMEYPFLRGLEEFPLITEVTKLADETVNFGGLWHTDTAYLEEPPMATMLLGRVVPPVGGDTIWASMYAAYDALSEGLKDLLSGLTAVNTSTLTDVSKTRQARIQDSGYPSDLSYSAEHPVIRSHPETGQKALYVNRAHTERFVGMTEEESRPLLQWLFAHSVRSEFTCRFRWRGDSLALWDNRCTLHNPVNDYHGQLRTMHRITLAGDRPRVAAADSRS